MKPPYQPDPLGPDFSQLVLPQLPDYEGAVQAVLVRYLPTPAAPNVGAVLYVHGFNDYFFQREMAAQYAAHGYHFFALDLRKYGRALLPHQRPNNVRDLSEYDADLDAALAKIRAAGHSRLVLSGHSTGGLITARYAARHPASFVALVLNSPFLALNQPWLQRKLAAPLAGMLGRALPNLPLPAGLPDTYGQSLHQAYRGEWDYNLAWKPNHVFGVNAGWLGAILRGQRQVRRGLELPLPVLVLHTGRSAGGRQWREEFRRADIVLNVADIRRLGPHLGPHVTMQAIPDAVHDVFLSAPDVRAAAYATLFRWLAAQVG
ncbi:alpha/beta hydrolase [Hymenobacter lapidiphilus]|uniref:Alpha/beta hydrolase n=1 Tax=Hymenobacter lapidiphilus TaxID=2608003 RepID=A0A7Y7PLB4_9BACT|nr:alpha/beta hydrolase [Hymenobacter lapidiphilus]NVO29931.1 alpha/beta hydrolase [Hymenobacter lapidiphilus]